MKKLLVFGCNGFVGTSIISNAEKLGWQTAGADLPAQPTLSELEYYQCDITNREAVMAVFAAAKPDYSINVAAIADIDFAEANQALAYAVNVSGAENIAYASSKHGARHLFFSSDAVYSGEDSCYIESSAKSPVNFYGKSKSEAEDKVLAACADSVIIRISLVLGFSMVSGNSFLESMEKNLKAGKTLQCPLDIIRTPIDVLTLSECVLELYGVDFRGIVHLGSTQSADRYVLTDSAAKLLGYPPELVVSVASNPSTKAMRHKNGTIDVSLAQSMLKTPLLDTNSTIKRAVESKLFFGRN